MVLKESSLYTLCFSKKKLCLFNKTSFVKIIYVINEITF